MALRQSLKVALVAGEESGDILGADLMRQLNLIYPEIQFVGMGGRRMIEQGMTSMYAIDRLAVMGLIEPLKRLPELLKMRTDLANRFISDQVDLFIGIDSPDFNLGLAKKISQAGIKTVHYVSPSVWAWRQGRVKSIRKHIDLMLTLLPFEAEFYRKHDVPVKYVGHPLATEITANLDKEEARKELDLKLIDNETVLALLPGSRSAEIKHLMPVYIETIEEISKFRPDIKFAFAAVNEQKAQQIRSYFGQKEFEIVVGRTVELIAASDAVLAASGTTTLEIMLVNRPMVVAYKADWLSYKIIGAMVKVPFVSLPNLIASELLAKEFLQDKANAKNLSEEVLSLLANSPRSLKQQQAFAEMRQQLQLPSGKIAAESIAALTIPDN